MLEKTVRRVFLLVSQAEYDATSLFMIRNKFESIELVSSHFAFYNVPGGAHGSISEPLTGRSRFRSSWIPLDAFFATIVMLLTMQSRSIYADSIPLFDFASAINSRSPRYWISAFAFVVKCVRLPRISPSPPPLHFTSPPLLRHLHTFSW